ncbi:MAG TPA: type II secretion system secretin GspD [Rudaea sp.]|nr:type II secretion system secretin GspD [Rudaea sp.]
MSLRQSSFIAALLAVLLAGCATSPSRSTFDLASDMRPAKPFTAPAPQDEGPIQIQTSVAEQPVKAVIEPGTGSFIDEKAASAPIPSPKLAQGQITFNFENQPIQAVVQAILGSLLKENYTIAPSVTGNVTFSTANPITPDQAMPILQMLLGWTNNALVHKQGRYEVVPVKQAIPGNLTPRTTPPAMANGYEVRVFPLKYIGAKEMEKLLKPYAKPDAVVSADESRNMIVMAGTAAELANYQRTIQVFDVDWLKGMSVGLYTLRNMDVGKVLPELDKIFGSTGDSPLAGMFRFIPMETTNAIVVITPQKDYLSQAETWIHRLDAGAGENGTQLYVYDVKNVKAVDLSDHLNAIYTGQVSQRPSNEGNVAPGLQPVSIGQFNSGNTGRGATDGAAMAQSRPQSRSRSSNLTTTGTGKPLTSGGKETDIRITPIEENNQLLVMATPGEWDSISSAIRRLDVAPLQVQIEAKILDVTLSGDLKYGVQWWLAGLINQPGSNSDSGYQYGYPGFQGNVADRHRASVGGGGTHSVNGGSGFFYSFLNKDFQVAINALQTNTQAKVLSTPSLVVMNNQQAAITVGTQVPVISTSIVGVPGIAGGVGQTGSNFSNTGIGQSSYISTGITLNVTPRVNPGGLVYMDIDQQDSVPGASAPGTNPPISQRNLQTQVAVQSGQTVLLGGMIQDQSSDSKSGVPLLSKIPLIGNLFSDTGKQHTRTELIVLITPRVITNSDEARQMTQEYESKFESLKPLHVNHTTVHGDSVPANLDAKPVQSNPIQSKSDEDVPSEK